MRKQMIIFCLLTCLIISQAGCGSSSQEAPDQASHAESSSAKLNTSIEKEDSLVRRETITDFLLPESDGSSVYENDIASLDASSVHRGFIIVNYRGNAGKIKLQITGPDQITYSYPLAKDRIRSFPLTGGNGSYQIAVLEHAYDDLYAMSFSQEIQVSIEDEFLPFLYPNQFSWYDASSQAVRKGMELSDQSSSDLDYLEKVYLWVTENVTYDNAKAEAVTSEYVPDVDQTLQNKTGICFDYASLMVAMLRSQKIPSKLEVGYSGQVYHAWISVYLKEHGWVDDIIEFNGSSWTLMDPTLAANNDKKAVGDYVGDGSNYTVKYHY